MKTKTKNLNWFVANHENEINMALLSLLLLGISFLIVYASLNNLEQDYRGSCLEYDKQSEQCLTYQQKISTMEIPFDIFEGEKGEQLQVELSYSLFSRLLDIIDSEIKIESLYLLDENIIVNSYYDNQLHLMEKIKKYYPELEILTTTKTIHFINKFQFYTERYFKTLTFKYGNLFTIIMVSLLYTISMFITYLISCFRDKKYKWKSSTWQNFIEMCKHWIPNIVICLIVTILLSLPYYLFLYNSNLMFVGFAVLVLFAMFGYAEYKART